MLLQLLLLQLLLVLLMVLEPLLVRVAVAPRPRFPVTGPVEQHGPCAIRRVLATCRR